MFYFGIWINLGTACFWMEILHYTTILNTFLLLAELKIQLNCVKTLLTLDELAPLAAPLVEHSLNLAGVVLRGGGRAGRALTLLFYYLFYVKKTWSTIISKRVIYVQRRK